MLENPVEIINKLGLHARASAKLVSTASRYDSKVELDFCGQKADAKSIMSVMMLAASRGSNMVIRTDGNDEEDAMNAVIALINNRFDEEE